MYVVRDVRKRPIIIAQVKKSCLNPYIVVKKILSNKKRIGV